MGGEEVEDGLSEKAAVAKKKEEERC